MYLPTPPKSEEQCSCMIKNEGKEGTNITDQTDKSTIGASQTPIKQ